MVTVWSSPIFGVRVHEGDNHDRRRIRIRVRDQSRRMDQLFSLGYVSGTIRDAGEAWARFALAFESTGAISSRPKFLPDNFTLALIGTLAMAGPLPQRGGGDPVDHLADVAIALLFFLRGASRGSCRVGELHYSQWV
jgi:hypothetical protein